MNEDKPKVFDLNLTENAISSLIRKRAGDAKSFWQTKYKLDEVRKANKKLYNTEYALERPRDLDEGEPAIDNRLFVAVRVLTPYLIDRLAQPEVTPADGSELANSFAKDFERAMVKEAEKAKAKEKFRLIVQDLLEGQRKGVGKWYYDSDKKKLCLKRLDPATVLVGHRADLYDEPEFIQEKQKRTIGELIKQFPDKKDALKRKFGVAQETPVALEPEKDITETWLFVDDASGETKLATVWMVDHLVLGASTDPNYDYGDVGVNILDEPIMPYFIMNFLNDGSGYEDETSFIEQAQYSQKNYDRDSQTISDDAEWGGSGVPVIAKGALEQDDDAAKLKFKASQRLILDSDDINKSFTTWTKPSLDRNIFDNKLDSRENVDNIFGTPAIFKGEDSEAKTLGENVILRDQAQGRHSDLITCIDAAMNRSFLIQAQLMGRFFDDEQYYKFIGDDGEFIKVMMSSQRISENAEIEINVKAGSSLPVDRGQRRAVIKMLLDVNKIGTLYAYRELGVDRPEEAFKQYIEEQTDPASLLAQIDKDVVDRDAQEDLYLVIGGKVPEERDDITPEYVSYLNNWLMTEKYTQLKPKEQQAVSAYVQMVISKAELKASKMATQLPLPPDPNQPQQPAVGPDGQPVPPEQAGPQPPAPGQLQSMQPPEQPQPEMPPAVPAGMVG
jgi:hypothetical protein